MQRYPVRVPKFSSRSPSHSLSIISNSHPTPMDIYVGILFFNFFCSSGQNSSFFFSKDEIFGSLFFFFSFR
jgi:hypothetical protein